MKRFATIGIVVLTLSASTAAQLNLKNAPPEKRAAPVGAPVERVTEQQARRWAEAASVDARGLPQRFFKEFDRLASAAVPGFRQDEIDLNINGSGNQRLGYVLAHAQGQLQAFERMAAEAARRGTSIEAVPWPMGPVVSIAVNDDESPAIERVIIRRGTAITEVLENHIELNHSRGKDVDSYEGWVSFPHSAFMPTDDNVQIDLIPKPSKYGTKNSITRLTDKTLNTLLRF